MELTVEKMLTVVRKSFEHSVAQINDKSQRHNHDYHYAQAWAYEMLLRKFGVKQEILDEIMGVKKQ